MGKEGEEKGRRESVSSLFKVCCYEDVVIVDAVLWRDSVDVSAC